jgi:hypothetical protein
MKKDGSCRTVKAPSESHIVKFKVFAAVTTLRIFFWVKSPCGLVGISQCFGEACCLHLQGGLHLQPCTWRQLASPKRCLLSIHLHGDLTQKNIIILPRITCSPRQKFSMHNTINGRFVTADSRQKIIQAMMEQCFSLFHCIVFIYKTQPPRTCGVVFCKTFICKSGYNWEQCLTA